jgi:cysteinyl-tRNA synthetase
MRRFVQELSAAAKRSNPKFLVIPQNGQELLTTNGQADGPVVAAYVQAIDGVGREDLYFGYEKDDAPTPVEDREYMTAFLDLAKRNGLAVLVIDYCSKRSSMDESYASNAAKGFVSFAADRRELDRLPRYPLQPHRANNSDVSMLEDARNFLCLLNPGAFESRAQFLGALRARDYDLLVIDAFFDGDSALTAKEVTSLKTKAGGGRRLVVSYLSVGEAENYRFYWQPMWRPGRPAWLGDENADWPGNYKVRYWEPAWQEIVYAGEHSYLNRILDAGFDGVYLDLIDAFEHFEN